MEDGQPTSTPTPCKMGCGFFVSLRYSSRFFPFVFPRRRPDIGLSPKVSDRYFPVSRALGSTYAWPKKFRSRPGPFLATGRGWEDDPRRRGCTIHAGGTEGRHISKLGSVAFSHTRIGPHSSPSFRADSSYSQHGTDRAWGRVERVSPQPLRGDQKEGYGRRIGQGSWRVVMGALDSIHSFRSFSFAAAPHKSLSFVGQALKKFSYDFSHP